MGARTKLEDYAVKGGYPCPFCGASALAPKTVLGKRGGRQGTMAEPVAGCVRCTQCGATGPKAAYQRAANGALLHRETVAAAVALWNERVQVTVQAPAGPAPLRPCELEVDARTMWQHIMHYVQTDRPRPRLTRTASAALAKMGGYEAACSWKPEERPEKKHEFYACYIDAAIGGQNPPKKAKTGQDEESTAD